MFSTIAVLAPPEQKNSRLNKKAPERKLWQFKKIINYLSTQTSTVSGIVLLIATLIDTDPNEA
jgi:hypothetical protein